MKRLIKGGEKVIQNQIIETIEKMGGWATTVQSGMIMQEYTTKAGEKRQRMIRMAKAGTPDILACYRGKFIAIEVKAGPKEIKEWHKQRIKRHINQKRVAGEIVQAGGIALLTDSAQDVADYLSSL